jgi:hypothetical protein
VQGVFGPTQISANVPTQEGIDETLYNSFERRFAVLLIAILKAHPERPD